MDMTFRRAFLRSWTPVRCREVDGTTKLIVALVTAGASYLLLSARGAEITQVQPAPVIADRVLLYAGDMLRYGAEQGVNPALIASMITVESGGKATAHGAAGEVGLMQVLPSTGKWIADVSLGELTVPSVNIRTGTAYLRYCIDRKGGNVAAGVAGYNYGPDRVKIEGNKIIVPVSVLQYMIKVLSFTDAYRRLLTQKLGAFYSNAFPTKALII